MAKKYDYVMSIGADSLDAEKVLKIIQEQAENATKKDNVIHFTIDEKNVDKAIQEINKKLLEIGDKNISLELDQSKFVSSLKFLEKDILDKSGRILNNDKIFEKFKNNFITSFSRMKLDKIIEKELGKGFNLSGENIQKTIDALYQRTFNFDTKKAGFVDLVQYYNDLKEIEKLQREIEKKTYSRYTKNIDASILPDVKNIDDSIESSVKRISRERDSLINGIKNEQQVLIQSFQKILTTGIGENSFQAELNSISEGLDKVYQNAAEVQKVMDSLSKKASKSKEGSEEQVKALGALYTLYNNFTDLGGDENKLSKKIKEQLEDAEVDNRILNYADKIYDMRLAINETSKDMQKTTSDVDNFKNRVQELNDVLVSNAKIISKQKQEIEDLSKKFAKSDNEVVELTSELNLLKESFKQTEKELSYTKKQVSNFEILDSDNEQYKVYEELKKKVDELTRSIEDKDNAIAKLNNDIAYSENSVTVLSSNNFELKSQLDDAKKQADMLTEIIDKQKKDIESFNIFKEKVKNNFDPLEALTVSIKKYNDALVSNNYDAAEHYWKVSSAYAGIYFKQVREGSRENQKIIIDGEDYTKKLANGWNDLWAVVKKFDGRSQKDIIDEFNEVTRRAFEANQKVEQLTNQLKDLKKESSVSEPKKESFLDSILEATREVISEDQKKKTSKETKKQKIVSEPSISIDVVSSDEFQSRLKKYSSAMIEQIESISKVEEALKSNENLVVSVTSNEIEQYNKVSNAILSQIEAINKVQEAIIGKNNKSIFAENDITEFSNAITSQISSLDKVKNSLLENNTLFSTIANEQKQGYKDITSTIELEIDAVKKVDKKLREHAKLSEQITQQEISNRKKIFPEEENAPVIFDEVNKIAEVEKSLNKAYTNLENIQLELDKEISTAVNSRMTQDSISNYYKNIKILVDVKPNLDKFIKSLEDGLASRKLELKVTSKVAKEAVKNNTQTLNPIYDYKNSKASIFNIFDIGKSTLSDIPKIAGDLTNINNDLRDNIKSEIERNVLIKLGNDALIDRIKVLNEEEAIQKKITRENVLQEENEINKLLLDKGTKEAYLQHIQYQKEEKEYEKQLKEEKIKGQKQEKDYYNKANEHNKKVLDYYKQLNKYAKEYYELVGKFQNSFDFEGNENDKNRYEKLNELFSRNDLKEIKTNGVNENILRQINKEKYNEASQTYIKSVTKTLSSMSESLNGLYVDSKYTDRFKNEIKEFKDKIDEFLKKELSIDDFGDALKNINKGKEYFRIKDSSENRGGITAKRNLSELYTNISKFMQDNTAMSNLYKKQLDDLRKVIDKTLDPSSYQVESMRTAFKTIQGQVIEAGQTGDSAFTKLKKSISSANNQLVATYLSWMDLIRYGQQMFKTIKDLDDALIDLRKTSAMNNSELDKFYIGASSIASEMGITTRSVIDLASSWSRLGYNTSDASEKMTKLSAQFAGISPEMNIESAQDGLISAMKAFDISTDDVKRKVLDNINEIGNTMAVSNNDIVEGLKRSASAMSVANNSFEQTIALITAGTEITRDAEGMGAALKTISMRIRGYDEETEELSEEYKNLTGVIADLTKTASTPGGISLFSDENKTQYKSTYQILKEISEIWNELEDKQQAQLLEKLFAKTRANQGAAILSNFKAAEQAMQNMTNAAGSADKEMTNIQQSITYKLNAISQTWVGILQQLINRGVINTFLDILLKLSNIFDKLQRSGLGFSLIITSIITAITKFNNVGFGFDKLTNQFTLFGKSIKDLRESFSFASKDFTKFKDSYNKVSEGLEQDIEDKKYINEWWSVDKTNLDFKRYLENVDAGIIKGEKSIDGFIKYTQTLKFSLESLGKQLFALGAQFAVTFAATAVIEFFVKLGNAADESRQKIALVSKDISDSGKDLDSYKSQISILQDKLSDQNLSYSESKDIREQLLSIQDELINKYGKESESIALITTAVRDNVDALEELRAKQFTLSKIQLNNSNFFEDLSNMFNGYINNYDKVIKVMEQTKISTDKDVFISDKDWEVLNKYNESGLTKTMMSSSSFGKILVTGKNLQEVLQNMVDLYADISKNNPNSQILKVLDTRISQLQEDYNSYSQFYAESLYQEIYNNKGLKPYLIDLKKAHENYNNAIIENDTEAIRKAEEEYLHFLNAALSKTDKESYQQFFKELFPDMQELVGKNELEVKIKQNDVDDLISRFKVFENEYEKLNGHVSSMNKEQQDSYYALSKLANSYGMTVKELYEIMYNSHKLGQNFSDSRIEEQFMKYNESLKNGMQAFRVNFKNATLSEQNAMMDWSDKEWETYRNFVAKYSEEGKNKIEASKLAIQSTLNYIDDKTKETTSNITTSVKNIASRVQKEFGQLETLYQKIFYDDDGKSAFDLSDINNSDLESIRSSFAELNEDLQKLGVSAPTDEVENLFKVLTDGTSTANDTQDAFNELADAYIRNVLVLKDVNAETRNAIVQQLEQLGVINSDIVTFGALIDTEALLSNENKQLIVDGQNLTDASWATLQAFAEERVSAENLGQALAILKIQQILVNENSINTQYSQEQILALARAANIGTESLIELARAEAAISGAKAEMAKFEAGSPQFLAAQGKFDYYTDLAEKKRKEVQSKIDEALTVKFEPKSAKSSKGSSGGKKGSGGSGNKNSNKEIENEYKTDLDALIAKLKDASERGAETIRDIKDEFIAKGFKWNDEDKNLVDSYFNTANDLIKNGVLSSDYTFGQGNENLKGMEEAIKKAAETAGVSVKDFLDIYRDAHKKMKYTTADYLRDMKALVDDAYRQGKISLDEYMDYVRTYLKEFKAMLESVENGVEKYLDLLIKPLEQQKDKIEQVNAGYDEQITRLKESRDVAEKSYDAQIKGLDGIIERLNKQKEALEDQKDAINKYYEGLINPLKEQVEALEEANQEREEAIKLEQDFYNLQRAIHQRTQLLYTEQGFQYRANQRAIREARNQLEADEYAAKIDDLQDQIKALEKEQEKALKAIDDQIDAIEKQIKAIEKQKEALEKEKDSILAGYDAEIEVIQKHKDALEKEGKALDDQIDKIKKYKEQWQEMMELEEFNQIKPLLDKMLPENWEQRLQQLDPEMIVLFSDAYRTAIDNMGLANNDINESMSKLGANLPNAPIFTELVPAVDDLNVTLGNSLGDTANILNKGTDNINNALENIVPKIESSTNDIKTSLEGTTDNISKTLEDAVPSIEHASDMIGDAISNTAPNIDSATELIRQSLSGTVEVVNSAVSDIKSALSGDVLASTSTTSTSTGKSNATTSSTTESVNETVSSASKGFKMASVDSKDFEESLAEVKKITEEFKKDLIDLWTEINKALASALGISNGDEESSEKSSGGQNGDRGSEESSNSFLGSFKMLVEMLPQPLADIITILDGWYEKDDINIKYITEGVAKAFISMANAVEESVKRIKDACSSLSGVSFSIPVSEALPQSQGVSHTLGFANGVKKLATGGRYLAWTQEKGREIIISPSSNAVLTPLSRGDSVLRNSFTENLFDWAKYSPNQYMQKVIDNLVKNIKIEISPNSKDTKPNITVSNNTFEVVGVTGDEVIRQIENQFSGIITNAYQRAFS